MSNGDRFVYLDTSVALAHLLSETTVPPAQIWTEPLISSRLLEYEIHTRLQALQLGESHGEAAAELVARVSLLELVHPVVRRPPPRGSNALRTLDALHLASMLFLRDQAAEPLLASYDKRLNEAAEHLRFGLYPL